MINAEADPDAIDLDVTGAGDYASLRDIEDDDEPAAKKASRSAREKGLQLRGEIDMGDDAAYKGRRSSRAEMYGEDESDGDMDDDLDLSQHAGAGQSDSDDESGDDSEDGDGEGEDGLDTGDEGEDELDTGDEEQAAPAVVKAKAKAEQKAKAGKKAKAGTEAGGDAELKALEDEYRGAREEDEEAMVTMRQKSGQERSKGLAVKNQQVLYDKSLEMRILLQKVMVGAAALPRTGAHALAVQQHPALSDRFTALQGQLCAMLTSLGGLHDALLANNPAIATASSAPTPARRRSTRRPHRRPIPLPSTSAHATHPPVGTRSHTLHVQTSLAPPVTFPNPPSRALLSPPQAQAQAPLSSDVMWGRLQHQHAQLCGYRDASLDRWHRRTALSSGAATGLKGGALKALNQSISQQSPLRTGTLASSSASSQGAVGDHDVDPDGPSVGSLARSIDGFFPDEAPKSLTIWQQLRWCGTWRQVQTLYMDAAFRRQLLHALSPHVSVLDADQLEVLCCVSAVAGVQCPRAQADAAQARMEALCCGSTVPQAINVINGLAMLGHLPHVTLLQTLFRIAALCAQDLAAAQWEGLHRLARKYRFLVHPQWLAELRASLLRGDPSAAADLRSYSSIAGCLCAFVQSGTMEILDPRVQMVLEVVEQRFDYGNSTLTPQQQCLFTATLVDLGSHFRHKWVSKVKCVHSTNSLHGLPPAALVSTITLLLTVEGWTDVKLLRRLLDHLARTYTTGSDAFSSILPLSEWLAARVAATPAAQRPSPATLLPVVTRMVESGRCQIRAVDVVLLPRLLKAVASLGYSPSPEWVTECYASLALKAHTLQGTTLLSMLLAVLECKLPTPPAASMDAIYTHHQRILDDMGPQDFVKANAGAVGGDPLHTLPALLSAFIATSSLSCCMEAYIDRNQPPQWSEPACLLQPADLTRLLHLVSELTAVVLRSGQGGLLSLLNTYRNSLVAALHTSPKGFLVTADMDMRPTSLPLRQLSSSASSYKPLQAAAPAAAKGKIHRGD
ncbi:MAG: hypothetical protein WDW38_005400 [Sanguina aurantia]